jgi:hypothetical protein
MIDFDRFARIVDMTRTIWPGYALHARMDQDGMKITMGDEEVVVSHDELDPFEYALRDQMPKGSALPLKVVPQLVL